MQKTIAFYVESWKEGSATSQKSNRDFIFVNVAYKKCKTFWRNYFNYIMHQ